MVHYVSGMTTDQHLTDQGLAEAMVAVDRHEIRLDPLDRLYDRRLPGGGARVDQALSPRQR